ncbi:NAD-dependent epimerase/dehydratase family protein [Geminicoccus roseus]|uniref:NAD-dependent epimerase/dehydratase family protein n=1 Tax=Geminicoccus roseus TaxID=404900 RepID=UPI0003FDF770|nr:NAD(P)-dependent oxidoreductase [Geminicoccus roseus]
MTQPLTVAITGGNGNLGRKLIAAFAPQDWCGAVLAIDRQFEGDLGSAKAQPVRADLTDRDDRAWQDAIGSADAVVHLAAQNPYPDASWTDSTRSFDMTINVVAAASASGRPCRMVFATSNHVMGRYKDRPEATISASLRPDTQPGVGTQWDSDGKLLDATPYATAKLMGERLCVMQAEHGAMTAVALRIGWCQPGANHPGTISASGTPKEGRAALDEAGQRDLTWFRNMWLSNRDFTGLVQAAILADASAWPAPGIVVNAMSSNTGAPWDLEPTERLLGYRPVDDVWQVLG